jgi:predicted nucleic-acid-binding Zn-ribbon protein
MQGRCPNCNIELDNALVTKESNIFKGNNRYVMCKNCGYIMAHNTRTNNIFGLERFQDDEEV